MMAGVVLLWQMAMLATHGAGVQVAARPRGDADSNCLLQLAVEDVSPDGPSVAEVPGSGVPVEEIAREELSTMENVMGKELGTMENVLVNVMGKELGVMEKSMGDIVEMKKVELGLVGREEGTEPAKPSTQPIAGERGPSGPKEAEEEVGGAAKNSTRAIQHTVRGRVLGDVNRSDPWEVQTVQVLDLAASDADLKGFKGGFTDGTYGYAIPDRHRKVARFDLAGFAVVQVLAIPPGDSPLPESYFFESGFTDGTYGYVVPYYYNGKMPRFDLAGFTTVQFLDLVAPVSAQAHFVGGFIRGPYGYALPAGERFGTVARFDLAGFTAAGTQALDLTDFDPDLKGFYGGFTDGTYGYAIPYAHIKGNFYGEFGKVPRFDLANFGTVQVLDLKAFDADLKSFLHGFTDGNYGYAVPYVSGTKLARFDLAGFATIQVLDLTASDPAARGFRGGFADGTYGYAIPYVHTSTFPNFHGTVARFDLAGFTTLQHLDLVASASDPSLGGYTGGFTDGTYGYAIPIHNWRSPVGDHGKVPRFAVSKHVPLDFSGPGSGPDQSSVVGDPHVVSVAKARFEIRAEGVHKLVQIPQFIHANERPDLRVDATIQHLVSTDCSKSFMTSLSVFGRWAEDASFGLLRITQGSDMPNTTLLVNAQDPGEFFAQFQLPGVKAGRASLAFTLKGVSFHVGKHFEGRYGKQRAYLNVRMAGLRQYKDLGGLLGYDGHADAEKPDANCTTARPAVADQSSFIGSARSVPSADGGSRIEAE